MMLTEIVNAVQSLVWEGDSVQCVHSSTDQKVSLVGRVIHSLNSKRSANKERSRTFSLLHIFWWASLLYGARAQRTDPFPAQFELSSLDGTNGFVIHGENKGDSFGSSLAGIGDVNVDGINDMIVSADSASPNGIRNAGKVYVIFGRENIGNSGIVQLSLLNGTNGFVINGNKDDHLGYSVSSLGDVDGDDVKDFIVGTTLEESSLGSKAGIAYVIFGGKGLGLGGTIDLSSLNGRSGLRLRGKEPKAKPVEAGGYIVFDGFDVFGLLDVNGDGFSDFLIRDPLYRSDDGVGRGRNYVLLGGKNIHGLSSFTSLDEIVKTNGFIINGQMSEYLRSSSISGVGDVNGDGIDDFVIGSPSEDVSGKSNVGKAYFVYGRRDISSIDTLELSMLESQHSFIYIGDHSHVGFGLDISGVGDLNGDGLADFLITAPGPFHGYNIEGNGYVLFGNKESVGHHNFNISHLSSDMGFSIKWDRVELSNFPSTSRAGDLNGDGFDDFLFGVPDADAPGRSSAGRVYVIFGGKQIKNYEKLDLTNLNGTNGFAVIGEHRDDLIGGSISGSGDINGDGIDDIMIGARSANVPGKTDAGKIYVIFGRNLKAPGSVFVSSSEASRNTPIIIGTSVGAVALLCSLIAGGVLFFWKKKNSIDLNNSQNDSIHQGNPMYNNLVLAPPPNQQVGGGYENLSVNHVGGQYTDWPQVPQVNDGTHYTGVDVVNRQHDQYVIDKRVKAQDSYDDL